MLYVFTALVFKYNLSSFFLQIFLHFRNVGVIMPIFSLEMNRQSQLEILQCVLQSETRNT